MLSTELYCFPQTVLHLELDWSSQNSLLLFLIKLKADILIICFEISYFQLGFYQ